MTRAVMMQSEELATWYRKEFLQLTGEETFDPPAGHLLAIRKILERGARLEELRVIVSKDANYRDRNTRLPSEREAVQIGALRPPTGGPRSKRYIFVAHEPRQEP